MDGWRDDLGGDLGDDESNVIALKKLLILIVVIPVGMLLVIFICNELYEQENQSGLKCPRCGSHSCGPWDHR
jgi:hypothetical protein